MITKSQASRASLFTFAAATTLLPALTAAYTGYTNVTIVQLTTYQAPAAVGVLVKFTPATPNLEGCSYTAGDYAWIDTTQADGRDVYASVLAGYLAGRTMSIGVHGCGSNGQPRVYGVTVNP